MKNIAVLGAGMVGSAIAADLSEEYNVTTIDLDEKRLRRLKKIYKIKTLVKDISRLKSFKKILKDFDVVISAVPGFMGFKTLKKIIESGKDVVDISFFEEDPFLLNNLARKNNVTAIIDCGVAPGLSNIILGRHNKTMNVESFECFVGGLPFKRELPFQYKAPFSPIDVIEEYTRPARIVGNGKLVIKPALSEPELINVVPVGTLEAFNSDGLRTLLRTMKIENMKEKTLRYPGHIAKIQMLKDAGFFSNKEIEISGQKIKPIDFSSKILLPNWKLEKNEPEFTVMRIKIKGEEKGKPVEYTYNLFDKYDEKKKISSMSRTTGYTCSSAARRILNKDYTKKGISAPENIVANDKCFVKIIDDLKNRNIIFEKIKK
jgi:lysine 6-dehydrogenase